MLQLTVLEFTIRTIPEALVYIFAAYVFSNKKLDVNKYLISSFLLAIGTFLVRMLPINYGVHTILAIIIQIVILIFINKIEIISAIKSSITTTICLFVIELLNLLALNFIFKEQLQAIMSNPPLKIIYGLPSLIGFIFIVLSYYYFKKKGKNKNAKNRIYK